MLQKTNTKISNFIFYVGQTKDGCWKNLDRQRGFLANFILLYHCV